MARIILVEDDKAITMGVEYSLTYEGHEVVSCRNYKEGKEQIPEIVNTNDVLTLALVDLMLPDGNGFELLKDYRMAGLDIPVIFLTAISDEGNVVHGLELGADDYIAKPIRLKELISRINAVLRRYKHSIKRKENTGNSIMTYGNIKVDLNSAIVWIKRNNVYEEVRFTYSEYQMLLCFLENREITLTRDKLLDLIFDDGGNYVDDNTLSVYIRRLRKKIDDDKGESCIKTVRGIGYRMESRYV